MLAGRLGHSEHFCSEVRSKDQTLVALDVSKGRRRFIPPAWKIMQELITVIVPAYNAGATLDQTLESVRSQSYRNVEILIIDDGSRDETRGIATRHAAADNRVRLISQVNAGVAAARNRGIAEARGKLIAPIDADDLWASTKLEKQIAIMDGPNVGLIYCWYAIIDADDNIKGVAEPVWSARVGQQMLRSFRHVRDLVLERNPDLSGSLARGDTISAPGCFDVHCPTKAYRPQLISPPSPPKRIQSVLFWPSFLKWCSSLSLRSFAGSVQPLNIGSQSAGPGKPKHRRSAQLARVTVSYSLHLLRRRAAMCDYEECVTW